MLHLPSEPSGYRKRKRVVSPGVLSERPTPKAAQEIRGVCGPAKPYN